MADFTHFTHDGRPQMVNVGEKDETSRTAIATGQVFVQKSTLLAVREGGLKKGDVLSVAQLAGIMGAKNQRAYPPMPPVKPKPY